MRKAKRRGQLMPRLRAFFVAALTLAIAPSVLAPAALAQTKVRVGQPQAGTFQFVPLQVGNEAGIFKKHGIEVEILSFGGGPRVQQAIAADSIDIGMGSGPELALVAKGAPEIGVAAMADAPYSVLLAVRSDSGIRTIADLKGKTVSISSRGSLTHWLAQELARRQGWSADDFKIAPLGTTAAQMAALRTKQIDGMIVEANAGYRMEEDGSGRVVVQFGDLTSSTPARDSWRRTRRRCAPSWPAGSRRSPGCARIATRPSRSCGAPPTCRRESPRATTTS